MIFEPFPAFLPSEYRVKFATEPGKTAKPRRCGAQVFCEEQHIFAGDDRDAIDDVAITIVAISSFARRDAGGRRHGAHPRSGAGHLVGLAARGRRRLPPRSRALGTSLIRLAVSSAHARGCKRFYAHVQAQNAPLFRRVGWSTIEEIVLHGRPHHFMRGRSQSLSADRGRRDRISVATEEGC